MKNLIDIAKEILSLNPSASLTGTLMLKLRDIDLGREPKDIDILIPDYATTLILPDGWENKEDLGVSSDGSGCKYRYNDIVIDIISKTEEPEVINGLNLGTVKGLIEAKYVYSQQNNQDAKKHYDDLKKLGFEFPEEKPIDADELPF